MSNKAPSVTNPRAMRGFVLDQAPCQPVAVEFDPARKLLVIRQGTDVVTIDAPAVEVFKMGMTWVREEIVNPAK